MSGLVALCSGSEVELQALGTPRVRRHIGVVVRTNDPGVLDVLDDADVVWVPEGTPRRRLRMLAPALDAVLQRGGMALLFGDHQAGWPASVRWTWRPAAGGVRVAAGAEEHPFTRASGTQACQLHHHGVLTAPEGAEVLLTAADDDAAVAYLDRVTTAGALLVSTIDPLAHFGGAGHPTAGAFLDAFLPWITSTSLRSATT